MTRAKRPAARGDLQGQRLAQCRVAHADDEAMLRLDAKIQPYCPGSFPRAGPRASAAGLSSQKSPGPRSRHPCRARPAAY